MTGTTGFGAAIPLGAFARRRASTASRDSAVVGALGMIFASGSGARCVRTTAGAGTFTTVFGSGFPVTAAASCANVRTCDVGFAGSGFAFGRGASATMLLIVPECRA